MTYSIWKSPDCFTLAPGRDIPCFADGTHQDREAVKVLEFEAPSGDAAHVIYEAFLRRATATNYQAGARA